MSQKYTDARYPEKINDLIDNEGGLSEEGKKAIEESGVEAKDPRIPEITPEDVGKMVAVDEEGNLSLVPTPSGGTKLYQHNVQIKTSGSSYPNITFLYISDSNEQTEIVNKYGQHYIKGKGNIISFHNEHSVGNTLSFIGIYNAPSANAIQSFTLGTDGKLSSGWSIDAETQLVADIVTEL